MTDQPSYDSYMESARSFRATIIEQFVLLEKMMDFYIASHFCKTSPLQRELLDLIICTDRITFESKRQVFKFLIENHKRSFFEENKRIFNDLTKCMEMRNEMAHYAIYSGNDALDDFNNTGLVSFAKFKNTRTFIKYNEEQIVASAKMMSEYTTKIREKLLNM